jgi:carboxylesterase
MVLSAPQDRVVPPSNSDTLATAVRGPVERVSLDRSFHVATLDYDRALIAQRVVDFAHRVTAG